MKAASRRLLIAAGLAAAGLAGIAISYLVQILNVTFRSFPFGTVVAVIGGLCGLFLLGSASYALVARRNFTDLNAYVVLGSGLAVILILFEAVSYVGARIVIAGLLSIGF